MIRRIPRDRRRIACLAASVAVPRRRPAAAPGERRTKPTATTTGPIKIALVNAQSGQLSSLGAWELKGAKLAVDEWNKAGGINGRQIELGVFDDQGDPTVGTNLARKIASEGYIAMLGTAESAVTIAMAPILQQAEIPNITSGQSPGLVAVKSPFLFLNGPTSTTYDETLAKYIVDDQGHQEHRDDHQQRLVRQGRARRVPQGARRAAASPRWPTRSSPPTRRTSARR